MVKYKTIRLVLALVVQYEWELEQIDVKTMFLHGKLEKDINMSQPNGFVKNKYLVCKLERSFMD